MVVVLSQENQLMLVRDLLLALNRKEFHVFAAEDRGFGLLSGRERLRLFCPEQEEEWFDCVWGDSLFEQAKRINLRYASLYGGAPDTDEAKEAEWRKLDGFTRYSNISSADYHQVQQKMLSVMGLTGGTGEIFHGMYGAVVRAGAYPLVQVSPSEQLAVRRFGKRKIQGPGKADSPGSDFL